MTARNLARMQGRIGRAYHCRAGLTAALARDEDSEKATTMLQLDARAKLRALTCPVDTLEALRLKLHYAMGAMRDRDPDMADAMLPVLLEDVGRIMAELARRPV